MASTLFSWRGRIPLLLELLEPRARSFSTVLPTPALTGGHPGTALLGSARYIHQPFCAAPRSDPRPQQGSQIWHYKTYERFFEFRRAAPHVEPGLRTARQVRPLGARPLDYSITTDRRSTSCACAAYGHCGARAQQEREVAARMRGELHHLVLGFPLPFLIKHSGFPQAVHVLGALRFGPRVYSSGFVPQRTG